MKSLSVTIIYNRTNTYGLAEDVLVIERLLKKLQDSIGQTIQKPKVVDIREPLSHCDIQFHLEIPVFGAIPWAHTNVLLVNPEQWSFAFDAYVHAFDVLLFRDPASAEMFHTDFKKKGLRTDSIQVIPWCATWQTHEVVLPRDYDEQHEGFACWIAGSASKYEYIKKVLSHWRPSDPHLTIYTTRTDFADTFVALPSNIHIICRDMELAERRLEMSAYKGHLISSRGEAFGYAAANAEVAGVFSIMNRLPVFEYLYAEHPGIAWLSNTYQVSEKVRYSLASPADNLRQELEAAFEKCSTYDEKRTRQQLAKGRFTALCTVFLPVLRQLQALVLERNSLVHCPPVLLPEDCPSITIVTPTYNRKNLIEIAFHNLLSTDYPQEKIEWVVIEDNEQASQLASEKIVQFQVQAPAISLKYIPIEGRMSIGEKRNLAIQHATHDIILFMDDDDHYPPTSFRRRVAWLTKGVKCGVAGSSIACCTTLALYDLVHGTSAVNVPPFDIAFAQRISEATLTFYKSAWVERAFSHVSLSEGEAWLEGREDQVIEMPPQQIIVAFSHGANQSARRVPPTQAPSCFWGFPKEYLIFIHQLAGVQVEETSLVI